MEKSAAAIVAGGERYGIRDIRVFGSIAHGADHFTSDIDLSWLVSTQDRGYFDIEMFLAHAVEGGREVFGNNSPAYASGSMAIIRTAALFDYASAVVPERLAGLGARHERQGI